MSFKRLLFPRPSWPLELSPHMYSAPSTVENQIFALVEFKKSKNMGCRAQNTLAEDFKKRLKSEYITWKSNVLDEHIYVKRAICNKFFKNKAIKDT